MAATAWLMLSSSSCIVCGFDSYTVLYKCPPGRGEKFSLGTLEEYGIRIKSAHGTGTEGQHQPRSLQPSKSLYYIGYTSTWLDVCNCVLMQEATTFNIFYDGISFQNLATVLISVFTLCYGPGLVFRDPSVYQNIKYLSVAMENPSSHWTDFHEISIWAFFWKSVERRNLVSLKSYKNNAYFT